MITICKIEVNGLKYFLSSEKSLFIGNVEMLKYCFVFTIIWVGIGFIIVSSFNNVEILNYFFIKVLKFRNLTSVSQVCSTIKQVGFVNFSIDCGVKEFLINLLRVFPLYYGKGKET